MELITKLPKDAVQRANLICINDASSKYYQVYYAGSSTPLKYNIYTGHGRIGHASKYLLLSQNVSDNDLDNTIKQIINLKIKKGYTAETLNKDPVSFIKAKIDKKPILKIVPKLILPTTIPITTVTTSEMIDTTSANAKLAKMHKKVQPSFNRFTHLDD